MGFPHKSHERETLVLSKHFGEQLMDAAARRSDVTGVSIRPSWVQWEGNYARNLSPALRDPEGSPSASLWAYIDVYDLADALRLIPPPALQARDPGDDQQGGAGQQPAIAREQALRPLGAEVLLDFVEDIGHAVILTAEPRYRVLAEPRNGSVAGVHSSPLAGR